jgi:ribonuclease Z
MQITVLGNGAGGPYSGRHYTAQLVQVENHLFLVDCGEGTQMQMHAFRTGQDRIRQVFITHLHGDHVFGLIGLLTGWCLKKRSDDLQIFSPPGLQRMIETMIDVCGIRLTYHIDFQEVDANQHCLVFENKKVQVWSVPLRHRTACCGWLFREQPLPRNVIKAKIDEYAIDYRLLPGIKSGDDLTLPDGRVVPNAELTTPPRKSLSYAFCSDTAPSDGVIECVRGVDLLYHEATFTDEHVAEAELSYHSTARQAAEVARQAGVGTLWLGHFSGRYADPTQHLAEARAVFANTHATEEGEVRAVESIF